MCPPHTHTTTAAVTATATATTTHRASVPWSCCAGAEPWRRNAAVVSMDGSKWLLAPSLIQSLPSLRLVIRRYGEERKAHNTARWLIRTLVAKGWKRPRDQPKMRLLDVGALGANYEGVGWVAPEAIDLRSRHPAVKEVNFFKHQPAQLYDVVCLSLVVNFVPSPQQRGEMLRRACDLLDPTGEELVFLVLPRACVDNSRYMDKERLLAICAAVGLEPIEEHMSPRLVYLLLKHGAGAGAGAGGERPAFGRKVVRQGQKRNNFAILLS